MDGAPTAATMPGGGSATRGEPGRGAPGAGRMAWRLYELTVGLSKGGGFLAVCTAHSGDICYTDVTIACQSPAVF